MNSNGRSPVLRRQVFSKGGHGTAQWQGVSNGAMPRRIKRRLDTLNGNPWSASFFACFVSKRGNNFPGGSSVIGNKLIPMKLPLCVFSMLVYIDFTTLISSAILHNLYQYFFLFVSFFHALVVSIKILNSRSFTQSLVTMSVVPHFPHSVLRNPMSQSFKTQPEFNLA